VARRSGTPCLFVSSREQRFDRVLVALDGTERGFPVLIAATDFARITGAKVRVVSVEPAYQNEAGVDRLLTGRSARLVEAIDQRIHPSDLGDGGWDRGGSDGGDAPVVIHRGPVVAEILREIRSCSADVLFLGYHRGGPAAVIDAGSVARRLLHEAPCGVITIPL
jgi:nucleotide-binding universal stress UspA family protein